MICAGNISQWDEVKKKTKERSQSKVKDPASAATETPSTSTRGGRGRGGFEGTRGGRGRGSERGRGAARGGRGGLTNGTRTNHATKTDETPAAEIPTWDTPTAETVTGGWDSANTESTNLDSSWEHVSADAVSPAAPVAEPSKPSSKPDGTRSWASMFSKPAPAPAPAKAARSTLSHEASVEPTVAAPSIHAAVDMVGLPPPPMDETSEIPKTPPASDVVPSDPPANITPSKDELTETNLEQVEDTSGPPPSATAASTVASTIDPHSAVAVGNQQPSSRHPLGGYATSAYKATGMPGMPGRSASYQRKILEQQEAVVMPGKHAVDRAAVQFGSMGLNGTSEDVDVDSDREDAETRAQPPQHSPIAPRAALPPAPQQAFPSQSQMDALPTPRQAPGLPPPNQQANQTLPSEPGAPSQASQSNYPYNNRYGPQGGQPELSAPAQKAYEPFGQQMQNSQPYDGYPPASQAQAQPPSQAPSQQGGYSSAANDMPSYYTSDNQRTAHQNSYYGNYGQHSQQNAQDAAGSQQRVGSAFGTSAAEQVSHYPTSGAQQQTRYGQITEAQASGHSTPNPSLTSQQPNQPHQPLQQQAQGQAGGQHGYPYGHPYHYPSSYYNYMNPVSNHPYGRERPMFDDVRRYDDQYLTQNPQFGYGGGQGGYGGGPFGGAGGKHGMYGQPHQGYGMNPQASYDQHASSSPANAGAFSQQASGRDSAATGGLGNYGRSGSAQPSDNAQQYPGSGPNNHSSMPDVFGRSSAGYPGQNSGLGANMGQQSGNEDSLRGYNDSSKGAGGPSPALGQPGGRPGSAANVQGQSGLPPTQGPNQGQQGYGGYMGHQMHGQGSQYGAGPGGLGGHHQYGGQNHQAGGYGAYGAGYGTSSYGNSNRGGWNAANYGH